MKASHQGQKWSMRRTDRKIPQRKFLTKDTLQMKMNDKKKKYSFKLTNDKHWAAISNADLLKTHI